MVESNVRFDIIGFVDVDYDIQHFIFGSTLFLFSYILSKFHVIPYKDDEYLNRSTEEQISLGFSLDASNISS